MNRLETCHVGRGEQIRVTFAADWWTTTSGPNQPSAFVTLVYVDGEKRLLHQYVSTPLVLILSEHDLLVPGREIEIQRTDDETGDYQVTWLEDGKTQTAEEKV